MKVLIVTDYKGAWPYIPEFREMLIQEDISVDILDTGELKLIDAGNMPAPLLSKSLRSLIRIPVIRPLVLVLALKYAFRRLGGKYDLVNLHFVNPLLVFFVKDFKSLARKIVVSVWGSDFYRVGAYTRKFERILYDNADSITFINPQTRDDFTNFFRRYADKSHIARFGIGSIKRIKDINSTETARVSREKLGLSPDSSVIVCGYNASPAQQHEEMVEMLKSAQNSMPDNVFLVFPMTYPPAPGYLKKIDGLLARSGFAYKVFTERMNDEDMARLRRSADIVINIQTTDQLSASIQEHLYAGNIVLTGKWLPYDIYDKMGVFFFRAQDIPQLKELLIESLARLPEFKQRCTRNGPLIEEFSGWEGNILPWKKLYETLISA